MLVLNVSGWWNAPDFSYFTVSLYFDHRWYIRSDMHTCVKSVNISQCCCWCQISKHQLQPRNWNVKNKCAFFFFFLPETEGCSWRSILPSTGRRVSHLHRELATPCHYFSILPVIYFGTSNITFHSPLPNSDSQVCRSPTAAMSCQPPSRCHSSSVRETPSTSSSASSSLTGCSRSGPHTDSCVSAI